MFRVAEQSRSILITASDLVRRPRGRIADHIAEEQHVCTSIIVAAELRYGAAKHAATGDGGVARPPASCSAPRAARPVGIPSSHNHRLCGRIFDWGKFLIERRKRRENRSTKSHR